jgi:hypothetical protein
MKLVKNNPIWVANKEDIIEEIRNGFLKSETEGLKILEKLYDYSMVKYESEIESKSNIFYRLTFPFYHLFKIFIIFFICPLKFVITGKSYFNPEGKLIHFFDVWLKKLVG